MEIGCSTQGENSDKNHPHSTSKMSLFLILVSLQSGEHRSVFRLCGACLPFVQSLSDQHRIPVLVSLMVNTQIFNAKPPRRKASIGKKQTQLIAKRFYCGHNGS
jgi:hypothetical protein